MVCHCTVGEWCVNWYLTRLFEAVMYKDFCNYEEMPVQRGIHKLAGMLMELQVVDMKSGTTLIDLD